MIPLQKYVWLIETIRRAGKITHKELSDRWERCKELSDCKPLHRATFNRWRDAIFSQFGIIIDCQRTGGYLYYIANPDDIEDNELKKWLLDSFAVGNIIGEHLSLKDRVLVDSIPSGRDHLTTLLNAMTENKIVNIFYKAFNYKKAYSIPVEPYCVKLFENRWYLLGHNLNRDYLRLYSLDRIESIKITDDTFKMPDNFNAADYFSNYYGIVTDDKMKPERIVIRANAEQTPYIVSLPLHHSQKMINENGAYTDFELYLTPTFDFIMKLLQIGPMIEVIQPISLRNKMKDWINGMYNLYM